MPPGLDLSTLKELPLPRDPLDRKSFSTTSDNYAISVNNDEQSLKKNSRVKLLAAGGDEGNLQISSKSFKQYYQISSDVVIPEIDFESVRVAKPKVAPIEGLELRHWSTGYGPSKSEIKKEMIDKILAEDGEPEKKEKKSKKKKHSIEDDEAEGPVEKKRKKEKKDKKDKKKKSKLDS